MKKLILMIIAAVLATTPAFSLATEGKNGFNSVWLTGSVTKKGGAGYGFGFRGNHIGCEVSYNDTADYESNSVWVVPNSSMMGASTRVGRRNIDGSFAMDFMIIVNPFKNVSIYGEGGPAYQETQDVFRQDSSGQLWSTKHNYGITGGGGGGLMLRIPTGTFIGFDGIQLSGGYHSLRGTTFNLGFTY